MGVFNGDKIWLKVQSRFQFTKWAGFIQPTDGGHDVFVHISAVERAGMSSLNDGQKLTYDIVSARGKLAAANIHNVQSVPKTRIQVRRPGIEQFALHRTAMPLSMCGSSSWNNGRRLKVARKPASRAEFTLFDVVYEDGSQRSNRKVPSEVLGGLEGDAPARGVIEEQDQLIAEKSGAPAPAVKTIQRSGSKKSDDATRSARYGSAAK